MKKDYSEYKLSEYDKYTIRRSNSKDVKLDYFLNNVHFDPADKSFSIRVDEYNEYQAMEDDIEDYEKEIAEREGKTYTPHKIDFETEEMQELRADSEDRLAAMKKKYNFYASDAAGYAVDETGKLVVPMINVFSGARIFLNYGEGILDFIYADFLTPLKEQIENIKLEEFLTKHLRKDHATEIVEQPPEEPSKKVYSKLQESVEDFYAYESTFTMIEDVAYASLYSAICPPLFTEERMRKMEKIEWYGNYLLRLQKEFKEMIEFCYDEDFYPSLLGNLYPSERLFIYRQSKGLPKFFDRKEEILLSKRIRGGKKMPYGVTAEEMMQIFSRMDMKPTEEAKEFAEKYKIPINSLMYDLQHPTFMSISYDARTIEDMLELEFTKMLEQDVRFRKCKRCGKYFIMKGNYDTKYCDRVAEGETRNCQELAAIENYKAKIADNKAIPIYNKYYKRYAARVKVRQIKEADFKKWKYKAMEMRDQCSDGTISVEEFTEWMESSFLNRKPKE